MNDKLESFLSEVIAEVRRQGAEAERERIRQGVESIILDLNAIPVSGGVK